MSVSEVLFVACDMLWNGESERQKTYGPGANQFICHVVEDASGVTYPDISNSEDKWGAYLAAEKFLSELGMPMSGDGFTVWEANSRSDDESGTVLTAYERQQVRYAWLWFAACLAEEEGL